MHNAEVLYLVSAIRLFFDARQANAEITAPDQLVTANATATTIDTLMRRCYMTGNHWLCKRSGKYFEMSKDIIAFTQQDILYHGDKYVELHAKCYIP